MPDLYASDWGWYAVKATPKREHLAAELLRRELGIESFAPRIRYTKRTQRGKVKFIEALFPGYLFAHTDLKATFRPILAVKGVSGLVRYGDRVPPVPDRFIEELRARLPDETHDEPETALRPGQNVTILEGPFKDWEAVVTGVMPARERVLLLVDFLGRMLEVRVDAHRVLAERDYDPKTRLFGHEDTAAEPAAAPSRKAALKDLRRDAP
jgi:transcriptional antiterminator RfaH